MAQSEVTRLESFEALLDEFGQFSRPVRPPTFMEIAGYPHYENVCSNILAFFMDPKEPHGLGTLVLDALANATGIANGEELSGDVSVDREVGTEAGNRIDILITADDHTTLIENKIFAAANNPFDDYATHLDRISGNGEQHKILLTLYPGNEGSQWGFTNLTHEEFVGQIRSLLDHYASDADTRYLTMFLDFLNTMENLQKGTRVDQGFIKFLRERGDEVTDLLTEVDSFKKELREKVEELRDLIDVEEYVNVEKQDIWRGGPTTLLDLLYHNIRVSTNLLAAIEAVITPYGWEINIWPRKGNRSELREFLKGLGISFEERPEQKKCFVHTDSFAYDVNLEQIRSLLQKLIDEIATSRGRAE